MGTTSVIEYLERAKQYAAKSNFFRRNKGSGSLGIAAEAAQNFIDVQLSKELQRIRRLIVSINALAYNPREITVEKINRLIAEAKRIVKEEKGQAKFFN